MGRVLPIPRHVRVGSTRPLPNVDLASTLLTGSYGRTPGMCPALIGVE
jgi:hypothetical protein